MITPEEVLKRSENLKIESEKAESAKEKIRSRQHDVHVLHLRGLSNKEISDKLGVSLSTVEKDLHEIRQQIKSWIEDFRSEGVYSSFRDSYVQLEQIQKELWQKYRQEKDPKVQIKILDSLADKITKFNYIMKEQSDRYEKILFHARQGELVEALRLINKGMILLGNKEKELSHSIKKTI